MLISPALKIIKNQANRMKLIFPSQLTIAFELNPIHIKFGAHIGTIGLSAFKGTIYIIA